MKSRNNARKQFILAVLLLAGASSAKTAMAAAPAMYAVDFVSSAATGYAMNDQGMVVGVRSKLPPGCTPATCLGVSEAVVWAGDTVTPLPLLPGFATVTAISINAGGWVAGFAGDPTSTGGRAVVWKPSGAGYAAIDLGVLPGTSSSWTAGIDDHGRAIGWSTTGGAFPTLTAPFVWTEATGLVNLAAQGFPNEIPLAVSPGGTVATSGHWYRLDQPSSVMPLAPPPRGFSGPGSYPCAINDAGDQVRFQISTSTEFFPYLFRYHASGVWQQIWSAPAGHLSSFGIGSINAAGDITATVGGIALIAYGPDGSAQPLATRLSPAYSPVTTDMTVVSVGGPINDSGRVLAQVILGRSGRLVRLVPAAPCTTGCLIASSIQMFGKMIGVPPGQCVPSAIDYVTATMAVTNKSGKAVPLAKVTGRFLDNYYLDEPVTAATGTNGMVRFVHKGPACVGTVSFLVEDVVKTGRALDSTTGELIDSVIPQP